MEAPAAGIGKDVLGDRAPVLHHLPKGLLEMGAEDHDQGAARGQRRLLFGAREATRKPSVGERGVVGAVVGELPAEDLFEERLCFREIGGVKLNVVDFVGLINVGGF